MILKLIIPFVLIALTSTLCGAEFTTVTLRSTVRMNEPGDLTLGIIAQIDGPQAETLEKLVLSTPVKTGVWTEIGVDEIRTIIDESSRVRIGSVVVNGTSTMITRRVSLMRTPPSDTGVEQDVARSTMNEPTIGDQLLRWLAHRFQTEKDSLRVSYKDSDLKKLAQPAEGRMVEVSQIGSSSRIALRVTIYHEERLESSFTINATIEIRRSVLVVRQDIQRGIIVMPSMVSEETRWFSPFESPARSAQILGFASSTKLRSGTVIMVDDVEMPIVIERGEIVSVRSIAGSFVANRRARALSNARDGEVLELESIDGVSRFTARASGEGRAVIVKDTPPERDH